ncbi:Unannotated [Lentimonas sp. CC19]|nr:Unannotated [Lentimonas sp. CC4]CAA6685479.1 Unannotated [Lentimonas sp. CC6]CAA6690536.1 Unannotated [Lentimonas sp. CC10]CAA6693304.1 Unannotated [Lentimonas sp. CC19]CAA7068793.1 Unannotated [Lentimonas sp. CC11]CAA7170478.1 Unannotated [Lentimonas sp. CC21]CAA7179826.1 Unannotated [Lentimonas sp. CC8]
MVEALELISARQSTYSNIFKGKKGANPHMKILRLKLGRGPVPTAASVSQVLGTRKLGLSLIKVGRRLDLCRLSGAHVLFGHSKVRIHFY